MDPERFRQIADLYHAAAARPAGQRGEVLAGADPEIRREVEALLAQADAGALPNPPAAESTVTQWGAGMVLGSYRI